VKAWALKTADVGDAFTVNGKEHKRRARLVRVIDGEGHQVAACETVNLHRPLSDYPGDLRNARLIAASPELLEALEYLVCAVENGCSSEGEYMRELASKASMAIRKAKVAR
jgi:hypothetical protein